MKNDTLTALERYLELTERLYLTGGRKMPRQPTKLDTDFLVEILKGQKKRNDYLLLFAGLSLLVILVITLWAIFQAQGRLLDILLAVAVEVFFFFLGWWMSDLFRRNEAKQVILQEITHLTPDEAVNFAEALYRFLKKRRR